MVLTKLNYYFDDSDDSNMFLAIQSDSKIGDTAPLKNDHFKDYFYDLSYKVRFS